MRDKKISLIDENSSPLHRIMSVYNSDAVKKKFINNICAFHIGNGIVLSVAHNLRNIDPLPVILSDDYYQNELKHKVNKADYDSFDQIYPQDKVSGNRVLNCSNKARAKEFIKKLDAAKVDRRYSKLYSENCCKPFLISSYKNKDFCGDSNLITFFKDNHYFYEKPLDRYSYIIELELLDELINEDMAIYRIVNTDQNIISKLPSIDVDFELYDTGTSNYYCLQTAPYHNLGRIINEVRIEGLLDNYSKSNDALGYSYIMDGMRYLIKGYFRFGSSGAPYVVYDEESGTFKANSIQSQASYIQMAIKNDMEGNRQFINGIATPLSIIEEKIKQRISEAKK